MQLLFRYLKKFPKEVILGPAFKLTEAIFELIVPIVMARMIDVGVKNQDTAYVLKAGVVIVLLGIVGLICALICQYFAAKASQGVGTLMRNDLYRHINSLSHAEIDQMGTPSLITRITNDVNQLQLAVAMLIRLAIRAPFLAVGAIIMAMILDVKLSFVFLTAAPVVAWVIYLVMKRSVPYYKAIQKKLDQISRITRENLEGARVIRAFSKQKMEEERFGEVNEEFCQASIRVGKISALLSPLTYMIMNLAVVAILWFGGGRVESGAMTQGEIIAFVNYISQILLALIVLANLVVIFTKASASAVRVSEVFSVKPSVVKVQKNLPNTTENAPKIEFCDVSFSYGETDEYALSNLTFQILKGQTVGIIGGTGSGKSTLVQLIPRFYDVVKGKVLLDGADVKEYPLDQLRKKIGFVPQQAVLFSGTIRQSLTWQEENASDEKIEKALQIAQVLDFVKAMPDGLDTKLTQGGKNVSGGQRQRLTIARALVSMPEILILDDSASALDYATDSALRSAVLEQQGEMTLIMVSQRAGTIRHADLIIVLEDGEVAGMGTHDELMKTSEVYREICLSQVSEEEAKRA